MSLIGLTEILMLTKLHIVCTLAQHTLCIVHSLVQLTFPMQFLCLMVKVYYHNTCMYFAGAKFLWLVESLSTNFVYANNGYTYIRTATNKIYRFFEGPLLFVTYFKLTIATFPTLTAHFKLNSHATCICDLAKGFYIFLVVTARC